jgi:hypothetical protein
MRKDMSMPYAYVSFSNFLRLYISNCAHNSVSIPLCATGSSGRIGYFIRHRDDLIQDPLLHSTSIWQHSVHPYTTGAVASEGWGTADYAAAVNQVPSCHELRLDKSRTEVWTNWPLPLLVLLLLLFLSVSQVRFNSVFLFKSCWDLSVSILLAFAWRLDLSRYMAELLRLWNKGVHEVCIWSNILASALITATATFTHLIKAKAHP